MGAFLDNGHRSFYIEFPGVGHSDPNDDWGFDWKVGCLGITPQCSPDCESAFSDCVNEFSYFECVSRKESSAIDGCDVSTCSFTFQMALKSHNATYDGNFNNWGPIVAGNDQENENESDTTNSSTEQVDTTE